MGRIVSKSDRHELLDTAQMSADNKGSRLILGRHIDEENSAEKFGITIDINQAANIKGSILRGATQEFRRCLMQLAIYMCNGNMDRSAQQLGIGRADIFKRQLKRLEVPVKPFTTCPNWLQMPGVPAKQQCPGSEYVSISLRDTQGLEQKTRISQFQTALVQTAIERSAGNLPDAAAWLQIRRSSIYRVLERLDIPLPGQQ